MAEAEKTDLVERYIVWVLTNRDPSWRGISGWRWEVAETTDDWDEAVRVWDETRGSHDPGHVLLTENCIVSPAQLRRAIERGEGTCQKTGQQP